MGNAERTANSHSTGAGSSGIAVRSQPAAPHRLRQRSTRASGRAGHAAPIVWLVIPWGNMPKIPGLQVVRSPISGYGVAATRAFAKAEVITDIDGVTFFLPDSRDDTHALYIAAGVLYDIVDQTRFVNHSCQPNTHLETGQQADGQAWARLVALRPIAAGDELSFDYCFPIEFAIPCRCGSAACRGYIIDPDQLPLLHARLAAEAGPAAPR